MPDDFVPDGSVALAGPALPLTAKPLAFNTVREDLILLARSDPTVLPERLADLRKVQLKAGGAKLLASLMFCGNPDLLAPGGVGPPRQRCAP